MSIVCVFPICKYDCYTVHEKHCKMMDMINRKKHTKKHQKKPQKLQNRINNSEEYVGRIQNSLRS